MCVYISEWSPRGTCAEAPSKRVGHNGVGFGHLTWVGKRPLLPQVAHMRQPSRWQWSSIWPKGATCKRQSAPSAMRCMRKHSMSFWHAALLPRVWLWFMVVEVVGVSNCSTQAMPYLCSMMMAPPVTASTTACRHYWRQERGMEEMRAGSYVLGLLGAACGDLPLALQQSPPD